MRIHRDAAPVIGDAQIALFVEMHLDAAGMAGNGLVHAIVDDFGEQVMQCIGIRAADIHTRPPPDRLEPFEYLDILGRIVASIGQGRGRGRGRARFAGRRRRAFGCAAKKVVAGHCHPRPVPAVTLPHPFCRNARSSPSACGIPARDRAFESFGPSYHSVAADKP